MSSPLVSVLIPAYNHEQYVKSTIQSILMQDYPEIELIIIDDGSMDNTLQIIKEMRDECEKRFTRVDISTQENQGTCVTLNRLISKAAGEYVLLIASDDELLPGAISAMVRQLESKPEAGLVVGRNVIMDSEGKACFWDESRNNVYIPEKAKYLSFSDFLDATTYPTTHPKWGTYEALLQCNHIPNGCLIRKSILDQIPPFTKEAPLEDWWLMLQIAKISRIVSINEETFRYRWHAANTIKQIDKMRTYAQQTIEWEKKHIKGLKDKTWYRIHKRAKFKSQLLRFLFQKKISHKGRLIIKICRIPVYVSKCK